MSLKKSDRRMRQKGRRDGYTFIALPHVVQRSANWAKCSPTAIKLLMDIAGQYNGSNNGDLCAALTVLRARGWTRGATIQAALRELIHYGLLEKTRQGGRHRAGLYALTWQPIDECGGKLDCASPSRTASKLWAEPTTTYERPKRKNILGR